MGHLEKFLNDQPMKTSTLVKAALAHVQFETIHPFLDGNGRLGRLLITLILCAEHILAEPLLYVSLYFKTHRNTYYDLLQKVRTDGEWETWLEFFARGVSETAGGLFKPPRKSPPCLPRTAGKFRLLASQQVRPCAFIKR